MDQINNCKNKEVEKLGKKLKIGKKRKWNNIEKLRPLKYWKYLKNGKKVGKKLEKLVKIPIIKKRQNWNWKKLKTYLNRIAEKNGQNGQDWKMDKIEKMDTIRQN